MAYVYITIDPTQLKAPWYYSGAGLYRVTLRTCQLTELVPGNVAEFTPFSISDSEEYLVASVGSAAGRRVHIRNLTDGREWDVDLDGIRAVGLFSWSPDGHHVAFAAEVLSSTGVAVTTVYVLGTSDFQVANRKAEMSGSVTSISWLDDKVLSLRLSDGNDLTYTWATGELN